MTVVELKVESKFFGVLIGKKGETIKKLNEDFENCVISIPKDHSSEKVTLRGPKEEVEKLRKHVVQMIEETRHYEVGPIFRAHTFLLSCSFSFSFESTPTQLFLFSSAPSSFLLNVRLCTATPKKSRSIKKPSSTLLERVALLLIGFVSSTTWK